MVGTPSKRTLRHPLLALGLALSFTAQAGQPNEQTVATREDTKRAERPRPSSYWQAQREGWFWYREPPIARNSRRPPSAPTVPRELAEFEEVQRKLESLKRVAVMNPSDENLKAYMRFQRMVMDRSQHFAERWQRLLWQAPELDYSLRGRPTNALAINAFDRQQEADDRRAVRALAATHGLVFVFRGDCPFCHRFAPILRRFAEAHDLTVLPISLDGGTLPEFPDARPDNGLAARLDARTVPALYLTEPRSRSFFPVGFGLMSDAELLERLATLARDPLERTNPVARNDS
jgi:conjugal transfer pilus assembly protein TraF